MYIDAEHSEKYSNLLLHTLSHFIVTDEDEREKKKVNFRLFSELIDVSVCRLHILLFQITIYTMPKKFPYIHLPQNENQNFLGDNNQCQYVFLIRM